MNVTQRILSLYKAINSFKFPSGKENKHKDEAPGYRKKRD